MEQHFGLIALHTSEIRLPVVSCFVVTYVCLDAAVFMELTFILDRNL